jgi:hypothetical protein
MKFSLKRKKKDDDAVPAKQEVAEEAAAPVAVKPAGGGGKEWLFLHAEKLVVGAVVLLLGYMVYSAIGTLKPDARQTPKALEDQVGQITTQVEQAKFPANRYTVPEYDQTASRSLQRIPADAYAFKSLIGDVPLGEAGGKRGVPKIYPVRDLEALGGSGIFFVKEKKDPAAGAPVGGGDRKPLPPGLLDEMVRPPADAKVEGRRWVAINALVPIAEQRSEYDSAFVGRPAFDEDRDQPNYIVATIRRLEITANTVEDQLDWDNQAKSWTLRARYDERNAEKATWAIGSDELIELARPRHVNSALVDPLGPLGKSWKRWAVHSQIPLAPPRPKQAKRPQRDQRVVDARPNTKQEPKDKPAAKDDDPLGDLLGPDEGGEPKPEQPIVEDPKPADPVEEVKEKPVTYQLCRIFDFSVEQGKLYRYQIQLAARNPNRSVEPRFLEIPDSTNTTNLTSEWSKASNTVLVPADVEVFAARILPPDGDENPEPRVVIVCREVDSAGGRAPSGRMKLRRGEIVSGSLTTFEVDARSSVVIKRDDDSINTDFTLLDFGGGETVAENVSAPVQVLVLDENGNLTVRNSATDRGEVSQFQSISGATVKTDFGGQQQPAPKDNGNEGAAKPVGGATKDKDKLFPNGG